jgi:putative flippase GtrA
MRRLGGELLRFGLVGAIGFVMDVSVLYLALALLGVGPYAGRAISYLVAASTTWYLNRRITFHGRSSPALAREWSRFVLLNAAGGAINYAVYAAWVRYAGHAGVAPGAGVALGSAAGLLVNFTLSRQLVFRKPRSAEAYLR